MIAPFKPQEHYVFIEVQFVEWNSFFETNDVVFALNEQRRDLDQMEIFVTVFVFVMVDNAGLLDQIVEYFIVEFP